MPKKKKKYEQLHYIPIHTRDVLRTHSNILDELAARRNLKA